MSTLLESLAPVLNFLQDLDPSDASSAERLNAAFPVDGEAMKAISDLFVEGVIAGTLCHKAAGEDVRFSRVAKELGPQSFTIDAVAMAGPGPGHLHPKGEFDLCFALEEGAQFDGRPAGWTVYPPNSWHVPTVSGGRMNILYFLPLGAIEFGPKPN